MPAKVNQNSFEGGLNTDVSLYNTPKSVLITAENVTHTTLVDNQFILQNEEGNAEVIYNNNAVTLSPGYVPVAVKVHNNIAYIISTDTSITSDAPIDFIEAEFLGDGLTVHYNHNTGEYGISGEVDTSNAALNYVIGTITTLPIPPSGTQFINFPTNDLIFGSNGDVYNHAVPQGSIMAPIVWSSTAAVGGYKTEIGTFPSPNWDLLLADQPSDLKETYSPLYNFKAIGSTDYTDPFQAQLGNSSTSEVDIELQQSFDGSVNIIFTDAKNPVRLVNSRFKPSSDNPNAYILADRTDLASRDTNVYSADDISQTNLIFTLSNIPELTFNGVIDSAGKLPEGNYKYYFKAVDADGNETPIIEESRTVSIFSGKGKTAHASVNEQSSKAVSFKVTFSDTDIENVAGINVYYSHFTGDFDTVSTSHKLLTTFRNKTNNSFNIVHTGLETTADVALSELNVQYTPVNTAKTISQIRSRLALANVTYSAVDLNSLAEASFRIRVDEEDVVINRDYSEVFADQTTTTDMLYSTPEDIYGNVDNNQLPGIGYWREETYVVGVNWVLENDYVTDTFPVKGIDRVKLPTATYTDEDSDTYDYLSDPFNSANGHENRLGVYRTKNSRLTDVNGNLIIKRLKFLDISNAIDYLINAGVPVKGYFFTRKDRVKDCLWEGISGGLHRVPVLQNYQSSSVIDWTDSTNNDRIFWLPTLMSQNEDWENVRTVACGSSANAADVAEAQRDLDDLISSGMKLVPSNGGWLETVNPHIDGYEGDGTTITPINGDSLIDLVSYKETGEYDYNVSMENRVDNNILPNYNNVNRVAFHSADMLTDLPSVSRDFESDVTLDISNDSDVFIGFKSGEIGTGGRSLVNKFYLLPTEYGDTGLSTAVKASSRLVTSGAENAVREQFSGMSDRNLYKWNGGDSAYEPKDTSASPTAESIQQPGMVIGSGNDRGGDLDANGGQGVRMSDALRTMSCVSTEYGTYFGCNLLNPDNSITTIPAFNPTSTYYNTRYSNNRPVINSYNSFGRYTKVYSEGGSLKSVDKDEAWKSLYNNLSGTYKSISRRYKVASTSDIAVGEGDCFLTVGWKQLTRKRGLPNDITQTNPNINTYYRGVDTKDSDVATAADLARSHTDIKNSAPLAYSQGLFIPLLHQNNNNVAIRSIEAVEPTEKNLVGSDREFYPLKDTSILRTRPQVESNKYNFGLNFDSNKFYTAADINVPAFITEFSTRVVLSNASATSEFSNGYRTFENVNFRDYNNDYGSITKLESFNNTLYCIQQSAVSVIGVEDRTMTADAASGKIFINAAELLPSTLTNINSEYGSGEFYSVIQTDVGIYGIDYIKNRPWRLTGDSLELLSEYKVQSRFNDYKTATSGGITVIPSIKTHFDRLTNKVYFNYNVDGGLGFDQNMAYNTNTNIWVGDIHFTPGISFTVNDGFYTIPEGGSGFWKHNQTDSTNFYGVSKDMVMEFVVLGDNPTGQKILENLKIASNNVVPRGYEYTVEDLITYNITGNHNTNNPSFPEPAVVRGDLIQNAKGESFRANIMQANTQYRENSMDVQVGKRTDTAARIRDKAIRVKIIYDGLEKVTVQQVLSMYRDSYA
jgi:hypothetical protein